MKFLSRKFIVFIIILTVLVFLRLNEKLDNYYFTICLIIDIIVYQLIEGTLDLSSIKSLETKEIKITAKDNKKEDENEENNNR